MILPKFRTMEYTVFRACERMGVLPPGVKSSWDDCNWWVQAQLVGYEQIRQMEGSHEA